MFANIWTALEPLLFIVLIPLALIWFFWPYLVLALAIWFIWKLFLKGR